MATIELNDDTLYTSPLPAGSRLFGAQSAAASEPTSFGREAIYNYVSAALSPVASSGSATDLTSGTLPLGRLHAHLADIASIASPQQGDLLYFNGSDFVALNPGTSGQVLVTNGSSANPSWQTVTSVAVGGLAAANNLSDVTNVSTARTNLGLAIGTNVQAWDAQLDSLSGASANGVSLVTAADYAAMRALLDLEAGTDFLAPAAIAAAYQPLDADLTTLAGLSKADGNFIVADGSAWTVESGATARASLGLASTTTDDAVVRYNGVSGATQNSGVTISDDNDMAGVRRLTASHADYAARFVNTQDAASFLEVARFEGDRATPTDGDSMQVGFYLSNDAGTQIEAARMTWTLSDVSAGTEDSALLWMLQTGGSPEYFLRLEPTTLSPASNNLIALGSTSVGWADLHLATGGVINWANGEVTLTETDANTLTLAGGTLVLPDSGLQVGSSNPFSDAAGTLTLQNVDALDATTEATIEAAIDTLSNLTSVSVSMPSKESVLFGTGSTVSSAVSTASFANFGKNVTANGNEFVASFQMDIQNTTPSSDMLKAPLITLVVNEATSDASNFIDGAGIIAQGYINGSNTNGRVWGGVFESFVVSGNDGSAVGAEIGIGNDGTEQSDPDSLLAKNNILLATHRGEGFERATAGVVFGNENVSGGGWISGIILRHFATQGMQISAPAASGALGLNFLNDADWGEAIRLPNAGPISARNAADSTVIEIMELDASNVMQIGAVGTVTNVRGSLTLATQLAVAQGGTGATSFTANGVIYGNGTSAVQVTAQGAANSILTANAGAPAFSASPTIGTSVTTPIVIGGTGTASALTLRSTSGAGATDAIIFQGGNNGATEFGRFLASGDLTIGSATGVSAGLNRTLTINAASGATGISFGVGGSLVGYFAAQSGNTNLYTYGSAELLLGTNNTQRLRIDALGNVVINTAAISTSATDGFLYVPTCAGTPTGTPTTYTGMAPIVVNTTNNKLYFYSGGAWRDAGP